MPNGTIVTFANKEEKAIIVFSHHTSDTMDNALIATGASVQPRVLGKTPNQDCGESTRLLISITRNRREW